MSKIKYVLLSAVIITFSIFLFSCKKDKGESTLTIRMVDAPGDYQEINVEVTQVRIHHDQLGWINLPTIQGIYDLLTLQNDISALLVHGGQIPAGHINQLRLILGSNNTVLVDDVIHPLSTPSAQQSGLKIKLKEDFLAGHSYEMTLDFIASESIVKQGNGGYSLKPVIKVLHIHPI